MIHSYSRQLSGHLPSIDDISRHIQSHVPDRLHDHRQLSGISSEDGSSDQVTFVGLDAMRDALLRRVLGEGQVEEGEGPGAAWQRRLMAAMNIQPCSGEHAPLNSLFLSHPSLSHPHYLCVFQNRDSD